MGLNETSGHLHHRTQKRKSELKHFIVQPFRREERHSPMTKGGRKRVRYNLQVITGESVKCTQEP